MINKKGLFIALFNLLLSVSLFAGGSIQLSGEFGNCNPQDSLRIYGYSGTTLVQLAATPLTLTEGKYTFNININGLEKGFYFVGMSPQNIVPLILGEETPIHLIGDCKAFNTNLSISGSADNKAWNELNQRINRMTQNTNQYLQYFRSFPIDQVDATIQKKLQELDKEKAVLLDSLNKANPFLGNIVGLKTYLSFQFNHLPQEEEPEYFARTFFGHCNLKNKDFERIHFVMEQAQQYANTLTMLGMSAEEQIGYASKLIEGLDAKSNTYAMLLVGLTTGFMGKNDDCFNHFSSLYLKDYEQVNPNLSQHLKTTMDKVKPTLIGQPALDFKLTTPEGKEVSLSDYKGKVVMVDFWASWCKPCRKENPNVVRIYNRFKDKGFEILGVSLDNNKDSWVEAIQKDKLTWTHVSDLAGWGSLAAKQYGVTGIPYTLIIGRDGKIIEKNLRGEQLEKKLEKILNAK